MKNIPLILTLALSLGLTACQQASAPNSASQGTTLSNPATSTGTDTSSNLGTGTSTNANQGTGSNASAAASTSTAVSISPAELSRISTQISSALAAVRPSNEEYSMQDLALFQELWNLVADQTAITQNAIEQGSSDTNTTLLADANLTFLTALQAKLDEFAYALDMDAEDLNDEETQAAANAEALAEAGIEVDADDSDTGESEMSFAEQINLSSHQHLSAILNKMQTQASDPGLRTLAATLQPMIQAQVAVASQLAAN